ncbi:hypothetical protein GGX14DRAFT_579765 [Mycena pura]|uniref:DUF6532 domain-containing protein n=1 Tax=Mycena pura TaxID=153505 RepID=A0AAD6UMM5_9AGAR|nr:hypothetical protein GGX14DRAFT_579765 [Mycena pura]
MKAAIALSLYEMALKCGYETIISRPVFIRRLMRLCAKKHPGGTHIAKRAKDDTIFCSHLALLPTDALDRSVHTRGSNLRTALRTSAISKIATYYRLNMVGITPSQVRALVKLLQEDQRYIFPYAPPRAPGAAALDGESPDVTHPPHTFISTLPFHAPAISDLIHEGWWMSPKATGFKHFKELKSNRADRPEDTMGRIYSQTNCDEQACGVRRLGRDERAKVHAAQLLTEPRARARASLWSVGTSVSDASACGSRLFRKLTEVGARPTPPEVVDLHTRPPERRPVRSQNTLSGGAAPASASAADAHEREPFSPALLMRASSALATLRLVPEWRRRLHLRQPHARKKSTLATSTPRPRQGI